MVDLPTPHIFTDHHHSREQSTNTLRMNWKTPVLASLLLSASLPVAAIQIDPLPERIRQMAMVYEHGRGVKQDMKQAYRLYCKSALMGDAISSYQYLRQKSCCFCMNPADFRGLENPLVD